MTSKRRMAALIAPVALATTFTLAPIATTAAYADRPPGDGGPGQAGDHGGDHGHGHGHGHGKYGYGPGPCRPESDGPGHGRRDDSVTFEMRGDCSDDQFQASMDGSEPMGSVSTDGSGNGSGTFTVPGDASPGHHSITFVDDAGNSTTSRFVVDADPSAPGRGSPEAGTGDARDAAFITPAPNRGGGLSGDTGQIAAVLGAAAVGLSGAGVLRRQHRRARRFE